MTNRKYWYSIRYLEQLLHSKICCLYMNFALLASIPTRLNAIDPVNILAHLIRATIQADPPPMVHFTILASIGLQLLYSAQSAATPAGPDYTTYPNITQGATHCATTVAFQSDNTLKYQYSCATFITKWKDSTRERFRFQFSSVVEGTDEHPLEENYGKQFLGAMSQDSGENHKWQCHKDSNGTWTFDVSQVAGPLGRWQMKDSVNYVLGGDDNCFTGLDC